MPASRGGHADELADGDLLAGGDDEIVGGFLLEHHPLHADVVLGVAPVAERVHVAEEQAGFEALGDVGDAAGDLAGDEGLAAARGLVVEEDAVAGIHAVGLAVVHGDPVGIHLGHRIGRARVERRGFRSAGFPERGRRARRWMPDRNGWFFPARGNGWPPADAACRWHRHPRCIPAPRRRRRHGTARRGCRPRPAHLAEDAGEVRAVGQIAIVQAETRVLDMRILVDVIDALGVEERGAALDAVDFVAFFEQEFREIGTVLSGDAGDECFFHGELWMSWMLRVMGRFRGGRFRPEGRL